MRSTSEESIAWRWPLAVAAVAIVVYANSLGNGFAYDDLLLVRDDPRLQPPVAWGELWLAPYWSTMERGAGLYRPLTTLSFAANHALGGAAIGFHAVNVALHALVSLLVWFVFRGLGSHYGTALAGGLLFAVHPLHTEAVANIAGRAELLAAAGVLAAWLLHRAAARGRAYLVGGALACYLAALLGKESAVLAPLLFWFDDRLSGGGPARAAYAGYAAALAAGLALRALALGGPVGPVGAVFMDNPAAFADAPARWLTGVWVLARYAWLFVWPERLLSDYSHAAVPLVESLLDPRALAGLACLALLGWAAWRCRGERSPLALGAAAVLLFWLPASNLPFAVGTLMAERLAYLPTIGGCLIAGHLAAKAGGRLRGRRGALALYLAALVVLLGALGVRSVRRNPVWRDNATLALTDVRLQPESAKLQAGAAIILHERGEFADAERHYRRAVELWPGYAQMHFNLARLLLDQRRDDEALPHLQRAVALAPANPRPYKPLARLLRRRGETDDALLAFERGTRLDPADFALRFDHGRALVAAGRPARGLAVFDGLVRDDAGGRHGTLASVIAAAVRGDPGLAEQLGRAALAHPGMSERDRRQIRRLLGDPAN